MPAGRKGLVAAACLVPLLVALVIYVPAAGHGFLKDDAGWILRSRVHSIGEAAHLFRVADGFYRPIVALTFAADDAVFGAHARGYGLTNVALAIAGAAAIASLVRAFGLPWGAGIFAGLLWLLNPDAIRGSILWISGRTGLVLTLAAVGAASALLRGRLWIALFLLMTAMMAKEEAVVLPFVLLVWLIARRRAGQAGVHPGRWAVASGAILIEYLVLRAWAHGMTPLDAPAYYRPTLNAGVLVSNIFQYLDWGATSAIVVTLIGVAALKRSLFVGRTELRSADTADHNPVRPTTGPPYEDSRTLAICGAVWFVGGYALTVFAPSRSELYACFPSVGACLVAAALCTEAWRAADAARRGRALVVALLLPILLSPLYYSRTRRLVEQADLSARVLADLGDLTRGLPDDAAVVIEDDRRDPRVNLEAAFGTLLDDSFFLSSGRRLHFWIDPPVHDAAIAGLAPPCAGCVRLRAALAGGRLVAR
jgi:hypothetical protein